MNIHIHTALWKVWRDLWRNKGRVLLTVLSIAVGVMAVGVTAAAVESLNRQVTAAWQAGNPAHAWIYLNGQIGQETIRAIARMPEVDRAEGLTGAVVRWKPAPDADWAEANLVALDDYEDQQFDRIALFSGQWPGSRSVAIEGSQAAAYGVPSLGGTLYFEVDDSARPMTLVGTVRDPMELPPPLSARPTFYVTRVSMERLAGIGGFNRLRFTIPEYSEDQVEAVAHRVKDRLEKLDVPIAYVDIHNPQRHFLMGDMGAGIGLIMQVMAVASLGLSVFLVINSMNALVAQQVPLIGAMKAIGASTRQIAALYLAEAAVYGLLSLSIAMPLGVLGNYVLMVGALSFLGIPAEGFEVVPSALALQILAGLLTPLAAALWPVLKGAFISVREALSSYGLGAGEGTRLLDRALVHIRLPRIAALALRNTFRRTGRALLTEVTLVAAGAIFLMVLSAHYSFDCTIAQALTTTGHDVVMGFRQPQRIRKVARLCETHPNVARVEMWLSRPGNASVPGVEGPGSEHAILVCGVPQGTQLFTPMLMAGRGLLPDDRYTLVLNQKLARDMSVGVGDRIAVDFGNRETAWTVVGLVFDLGDGGQNTAYVPRRWLGAELGLAGRATVAEVRLRDNSSAAQQATEKDLRRRFESAGVDLSFSDTASAVQMQYSAQFGFLTSQLLFMTILVAVVGAMGLSGILSINVLERQREIGVMRAVGASTLHIARIFVGEGVTLGLLSWALAIPFSLFGGLCFVEGIGQVINFPVFYHYSFAATGLWLAIVVVLSLLASWLPARRATRISVRESLIYG
jgi:putative ABC transport system permease protein